MAINKNKDIKTNAMRILDREKISYQVITYECEEFIDGLHCAEITGVNPEESFKTLILTGKSEEHYVAVIPVGDEIDFKKFAAAAGEKSVSMLPLKDVTKVSGYVRGGVSPIGMKKLFTTIIDKKAENFSEIYVSGGRIGSTVRLAPGELLRAVKGKTADIIL